MNSFLKNSSRYVFLTLPRQGGFFFNVLQGGVLLYLMRFVPSETDTLKGLSPPTVYQLPALSKNNFRSNYVEVMPELVI